VGLLVACRQFCTFLIIGFPVSGATIDRFQMTNLTLASNVGDGLLYDLLCGTNRADASL